MALNPNNQMVLITGGGAGIGKELGKLFYAQGYSLVVASLLQSELMALEAELSEKTNHHQGQKIITIQIDLSEDNSAEKLFREIKVRDITVDILVNNAGFGAYGQHVQLDYRKVKAMVNLNCQTPSLLCHLFGNEMKSRKQGKILNVGSTISFQPLPYLTNYAASKAFMVNFSEAFAAEMAPYGVQVSCLCPGTTATAFLDTAGIHSNQVKGSVGNTAHQIAMSASSVAKIGFDGFMKGKRKIIPGTVNQMHHKLIHWIPNRVITWATARVFALGEARQKLQSSS